MRLFVVTPVCCLVVCWFSGGALAQPAPPVGPAPVAMPPAPSGLPMPPSPVEEFRRVLNLPVAERETYLAGKKTEYRVVLEAKCAEYDGLTPAERETRLQTLQLRYYLSPLLKTPATNRVVALARVPAAERALVEERLRQWDQLPPEQQREFLEHEAAARLILQPDANLSGDVTPRRLYTPDQRSRIEQQVAAWNNLPNDKRQQITAHFGRFFTLSGTDKVRALGTLDEGHRRALKLLDQLPPEQRDRYLANFKKFADLSTSERDQFLRTVVRWRAMSDQQREAWRKLAGKLPPGFPFPPQSNQPPMPPGFNKAGGPPKPVAENEVATNR